MKGIELTAAEVKTASRLLLEAQIGCRGDLRTYNLCRRVRAILGNAGRRFTMRHGINPLLLDAEVIKDIFAL
jgi:hypothetical protein